MLFLLFYSWKVLTFWHLFCIHRKVVGLEVADEVSPCFKYITVTTISKDMLVKVSAIVMLTFCYIWNFIVLLSVKFVVNVMHNRKDII